MVDLYKPQLEPFLLENISLIRCECFIWKVPRSVKNAGLILFKGKYLPGSLGRDDALFIKWRINEFAEVSRISGLVIDLRELDYVWGDDLDVSVPKLRRVNLPERVVIPTEDQAPEQHKAFLWAIDSNNVRTDIDLAFTEVKDALTQPKPKN